MPRQRLTGAGDEERRDVERRVTAREIANPRSNASIERYHCLRRPSASPNQAHEQTREKGATDALGELERLLRVPEGRLTVPLDVGEEGEVHVGPGDVLDVKENELAAL